MKKKNAFILPLLAATLLVTGCASKKDLENCQTENRELTHNYMTAKEQLAAAQARLTSLEEQLAQQKSDYAALHKSLDKSLLNTSSNNINISKLVDQINESNQYIRHLVEVKSKSDSLNMVLTNNLTRSLSREELKEVDVQVLKGVVYISLADNMLYKSGSYEINDRAAETLSKIAKIIMVLTNNLTRSLSREELKEVDVQVLKGVVYISLADNMLYKSGSYEINDRAAETLSKIAKIIMDYKDYDVLVEGNTDNVPVNQNSPLMKNIRNNWDLSALRASSVVQFLQNHYGVDPKRMTAGGRGEYNPLTSNDTELGKQRNRRTQIIITPKLDQFMDLIDKAPENEGMAK